MTTLRFRALRRAGCIAAVAGAILSMAAYGGAGAGARTARTAATVDPEAVLRYGTDFEMGIGPTLDPAKYNSTISNIVGATIYGTMMRPTPDGPVGDLATAWEFPDEQTVVLTLREGVTFHDGTPFNAEAVKYAWDRIIDTPTGQGGMVKIAAIAAMESVEVLGEYEVQVNLSAPVAGDWRDRVLLQASSGLGVPSMKALQEQGDAYGDHPVGAGAFEFVSYEPGQQITLRRYADYWDSEHFQLGGVEIVQVANGAPRVTALASGAVDVAMITPAEVGSVEAQRFEIIESYTPINTSQHIQFCPSKPPFDTPEAREAIALAINPVEIVASVFQGHARPTRLYAPSDAPFYPADLEDEIQYDPDRARQLLADAGVAEGTSVSLMVATTPVQVATAEVIQGQLEDVGLDVEIVQSQNVFVDAEAQQPNMTISGNFAMYSMVAYLVNPGVGNFCDFDEADVAEAFTRTRQASSSEEEITQAQHDLQEALFTEFPNAAFAQVPVLEAQTGNVHGLYTIDGSGPWLADVTITS